MPKIVNPITIVKTGGGPTPPTPQPLDPEQVYRDTRPADWLVMPEPQEDEIYFLCQISKDTVDDQVVAFDIGTSGQGTVEVGVTDSAGVFTPYSQYTATGTGLVTTKVPASIYGNVTAEGNTQLMCKVSAPSLWKAWNRGWPRCKTFFTQVFEISSYAHLSYIDATTDNCLSFSKLRYASFKGQLSQTNLSRVFSGCRALIALRQLDTSNTTNFSFMFNECPSLAAIPQLDMSSGTIFTNMFSGCHSLTAIPQLDAPNGTDFRFMFQYCSSLTTIPQLDTSSGTNFQGMFGSCSSLTTIPQLNTSSGTIFTNMFSGCYSLTSIPQLDTSNGDNFSTMFGSCSSLTSIPQLDTSSGTNFSSMFSSCSSLTTIPQLDTSSGTNFSGMFSSCYSLTTIPQLNTSSGTNFQGMFQNCSSLTSIPQLNTSNGTIFTNMFNNCYSLTTIPQLVTSSGTNFQGMFSGCYGASLLNLTTYDFTLATNVGIMLQNISGGVTVDLGSTWGSSGIPGTSGFISLNYNLNTPNAKVRINKTDAMLPINTNATTLFYSGVDVYVPDALLATYQADTRWATLGTRLKAMSEWSA